MTDNATVKEIDPFNNLEALRLSGDPGAVEVEKVLTRVVVRKPNAQEFLRVHGDGGYRFDTPVIELKDDREVYLVGPAMRGELAAETKPVRLYTAVTRAGTPFLWPVPLPLADGKANPWHASAHEAAQLATRDWVRVRADMSAGMYEVHRATGRLGEPQWPALAFDGLLRLAFKDAIINCADHPVVRRLRGES